MPIQRQDGRTTVVGKTAGGNGRPGVKESPRENVGDGVIRNKKNRTTAERRDGGQALFTFPVGEKGLSIEAWFFH